MFYAYEVAGSSAEQATVDVNEALEPLHFFASQCCRLRLRLDTFECDLNAKVRAGSKPQCCGCLRECGKFEAVTPLGPVHTE